MNRSSVATGVLIAPIALYLVAGPISFFAGLLYHGSYGREVGVWQFFVGAALSARLVFWGASKAGANRCEVNDPFVVAAIMSLLMIIATSFLAPAGLGWDPERLWSYQSLRFARSGMVGGFVIAGVSLRVALVSSQSRTRRNAPGQSG